MRMWKPFELPSDYSRFIKFKGGDIPPWTLIRGENSQKMSEALKKDFPSHSATYPFALRSDSEDVAAFEKDRSGKIVVRVIHLGTPPGTEIDSEYESFCDWLV